jgi:SPP1 gp7 family putative phage head morphogenesis protein
MSDLRPLPFVEAIQYARRRNIVLPETYYGELSGMARRQSFSIAGVAEMDQLQGVLDSLSKAMDEGQSFGEWKAQVSAGERGLDLPDHRLDNIFRTNLQTHYSRGRCEQQRRNRERRPYFMWDATDDDRVRPHHWGMDGHVAPQDDPIWEAWSPPAGFRCRCRRISLTEKQAERFLEIAQRRIANDPAYAEAHRNALQNGPDEGFNYDTCRDIERGIDRSIERHARTVNPKLLDAFARRQERKPTRLSVEALIDRGQSLASEIDSLAEGLPNLTAAEQFQRGLFRRLADEGIRTGKSARIVNRGRGVTLVKEASLSLPNRWTEAANAHGDLRVRFHRGRAFQYTFTEAKTVRLPVFGVVDGKPGQGFITANSRASAIHEYTHRIQHALPELDDYFQALHARRTHGEPLQRLSQLTGLKYNAGERAKPDKYLDPYMGKEYHGIGVAYEGRSGALELMPMTYEILLSPGSQRFERLRYEDPELFNLAIGLLFHYVP